jgi:hypothetical protein
MGGSRASRIGKSDGGLEDHMSMLLTVWQRDTVVIATLKAKLIVLCSLSTQG